MNTGRAQFLSDLIDTVKQIIIDIEDRDPVEPDMAIIRELAEQLLDEAEALEEY